MGVPSPILSISPVLLISVLVVTAGCSTIASDEGDTPSEPTVHTLTTVEPPLETMPCHCVRNGRFELHHMYDGPVAVSITDITDGNHDMVLDGVYTEQYDIQSFDPVMQYGSDYRVIIRVDGEEAWNQTISRADGYELLVATNGSVSVLSHGGV